MYTTPPSKPHIFITAGDPSADVHAASLMEAIRNVVPDVIFEGFGGPAMEMQGLRSLAHIRDLAVTGFWEVAKRYAYFRKLMSTCEQAIARTKPVAFVPVDYPGFNLRLARRVRSASLPVVWYIAPQLWAWGEKRASDLASVVDRLLVVFPFEVEFFAKHGIRATYVGHPLMEVCAKEEPQQRVPQRVLLMPGSRKQEVAHHVPLLANSVDVLRKHLPNAQFVAARARNVEPESLQPLLQRGVEVTEDAALEMHRCSAALIKAGTSTLEATVRGLPFATFYRTSALSYAISKHLVKVESVTMANLLLQRNVVHEFIQSSATPEALSAEVLQLLSSEVRRTELRTAMEQVQTILRGEGAAANAASVVAGVIGA